MPFHRGSIASKLNWNKSVSEIYCTSIIRVDINLHRPWWWRQSMSPKRWFRNSTMTRLTARKHFKVLKRDITPYSPLKLNRCYRGSYRVHLQGGRINPGRSSLKQVASRPCFFYVSVWFQRFRFHVFACCFVWVWNLVCNIKRRTLIDAVSEQDI
jgi:hypothetical protein